jgi:dienelactone hydrolase
MADILLFHHVLGLTPGVHAFADSLRGAGHTVHVPDLFEGRRFDSIDAGAGHVDAIGFGTILERGVAAADGLPEPLVYAGFSLGVVPAQCLAQTRPGAAGAVLMEACVPVSEFGEAWPAGVPVQVHGMSDDAFFAGEGDIDAARALVASVDDAELFVYPGDGHLFADPASPWYDAAAAALMLERVLAFLDAR